MALLRTEFFSETLDIQCQMNVVYPQRTARSPGVLSEPPAVLYLLHGLTDDHNAFMLNTPVVRLLHGLNVMTVMPYASRSFYTNQQRGYRYFDFMSQELPHILKQFFTFSQEREKTYVCGFSMGGFGALKLALALPERYGRVAALAPVVFTPEFVKAHAERSENADLIADMNNTFGEYPSGSSDLLTAAASFKPEDVKPEVRIDVGSEDFLLPGCKAINDVMAENGFDVSFNMVEGEAHTWPFVESCLASVLSFLTQE